MSTITCTHRVSCRRANCADRFTNENRHSAECWERQWTVCLGCGGGAEIVRLRFAQDAELSTVYHSSLGLNPVLGVAA